MAINTYSVAVTTTGSAGTATGSGTLVVPRTGLIEWIYLDYNASAPGATTDVTVAHAATPPGGNVLVVTDSVTDALIFPRAKPVDNANGAITNAHTRFTVHGDLTVSVAQCDALTAAVTVYVAVSS